MQIMAEKREEKEQSGRLTLRKGERLHHRTLVEGLFAKGKTLYDFPLRLTWRVITEEDLQEAFRHGVPEGIGGVQMLVTVPKKKRRRAVDRVLMRRRIREAYRLNRLPLKRLVESKPEIRSLQLAFIYLKDSNADYAEIERKMQGLIGKMMGKIGNF